MRKTVITIASSQKNKKRGMSVKKIGGVDFHFHKKKEKKRGIGFYPV